MRTDCYVVKAVDPLTFRNYNSIVLEDKNGNYYFLISKKVNLKDTSKYFSKLYQEILKGEEYCLKITEIDSIVTMKINSPPDLDFIYAINNLIIWSKDTVRIKSYTSGDILDIYIKNP